jgi:hypothetical protein
MCDLIFEEKGTLKYSVLDLSSLRHTNGDYWIQDNQQATTKTDVCDAETARFYFVKPLPLPQNPW